MTVQPTCRSTRSIQDRSATTDDVQEGVAETWAVRNAQEKNLDVADMKLLTWMIRVGKLDRRSYERKHSRDDENARSIQENRLNWNRPVMKREEGCLDNGVRRGLMEKRGKEDRSGGDGQQQA